MQPDMISLPPSAVDLGVVGDGPQDIVLTGDILVVSPPRIDFGGIGVGSSSAAMAVNIQNVGGWSIEIAVALSGVNAADFAFAPGPTNGCGATLEAGASCTVIVTFKPTRSGARSGLLIVSVTGGRQATAALEGIGGIVEGPVISPAAKNFGAVSVGGASEAAVFTLSNIADRDVTIGSPIIGGPGMSQFAVNANTCGSVLEVGATCMIAIVFTPTSGGEKAATLSVSAQGWTALAALSGTGVEVPKISIFPSTQSYGSLWPNQRSVEVRFMVTNNGGASTPALRTSISSPQFVKGMDTCAGRALAPNETCSIAVAFAPTSFGSFVADLAATAGTATAIATLKGSSGVPADFYFLDSPTGGRPTTVQDFGSLTVGFRTQGRTVYLRNNGTQPSSMISMAIYGAAADDFIIEANTCGPPLAPGASCAVTVFFKPTAGGDRQALLVASDTVGGRGSLTLSGRGEATLELVAYEGGVLKPTAPAGSPADFGQAAIGTAPATFPGRRDFVLVARAATGALNGSVRSGAPVNFRISGVTACRNRVKIVAGAIVTSSLTTNAATAAVAADGQVFTHAGLDPMNQSDPELASVCTVTLQFTPQDPVGDKTGTLEVTASAGLTASHGLKGTATP